MADVFFLKTSNGLIYASEDDREAMKRIGKIGSVIKGKFSAPRNGQFHRKCRVLQETLFDNQDMTDNKDDFREWLKLKTGLYEWKTAPDGSKYPKTKSTAYDAMDEVAHSEWYQKLITFAIQDGSIFEGKTPEQADAFVDQILGGFC